MIELLKFVGIAVAVMLAIYIAFCAVAYWFIMQDNKEYIENYKRNLKK